MLYSCTHGKSGRFRVNKMDKDITSYHFLFFCCRESSDTNSVQRHAHYQAVRVSVRQHLHISLLHRLLPRCKCLVHLSNSQTLICICYPHLSASSYALLTAPSRKLDRQNCTFKIWAKIRKILTAKHQLFLYELHKFSIDLFLYIVICRL